MIVEHLGQTVRYPVRWRDATRLMAEVGITTTLQIPLRGAFAEIAALETLEPSHVVIGDIGLSAAYYGLARQGRIVNDVSKNLMDLLGADPPNPQSQVDPSRSKISLSLYQAVASKGGVRIIERVIDANRTSQ
jgi:hypothetical protein